MIPNYALIGVRLSEPHTSVTTLFDACVCMLVCLCVAIPKFKLNELMHQICTCAGAKSSHKSSNLSLSNSTLMDLLNATADHDRQWQAAHRRYRQITHSSWVHFRWGPSIMTLISTRVSACDFVVKFSTSACVAVVAYLIGEMAAWHFAYHVHGPADSDKSCCYPWFVCHDKTLN